VWNPPEDFSEMVWLIVRQVPAGKVTTYGQVASMIPPENASDDDYSRRAPRWVGVAMNRCPSDVPWQRVINSRGRISLSGTIGAEQRQRLEQEGVKFDAAGRVDLRVYGWQGPDEAFLEEHDLNPPAPFDDSPRQDLLL
jgi:methylated-DNA-protein-cysteine methyltransferase-like protein